MAHTKKRCINGTRVKITHANRVLFPQAQLTKEDVCNYYERIAPTMLPHIADIPLVQHCFPEGLTQDGFYRKQVPNHFAGWIKRATIDLKQTDEEQELIVATKAADLVYCVQQSALAVHPWLSKHYAPHTPVKIVFDLDPPDPYREAVDGLRDAARLIRTYVEQAGLHPYLMTTGSRGYHVVVPIQPQVPFETARTFARKLAERAAHNEPDRFTTEIRKEKRDGRIFIDYLRTSYGQTSIAPYSLRARKGAPVATPLDWNELGSTRPQTYTIANIMKRLGQKNDPWKDMYQHAGTLV